MIDTRAISRFLAATSPTVEEMGDRLRKLGLLISKNRQQLLEEHPCEGCRTLGLELAQGITGIYYRRCSRCYGRGYDLGRKDKKTCSDQ
jgi:hypothetical protein